MDSESCLKMCHTTVKNLKEKQTWELEGHISATRGRVQLWNLNDVRRHLGLLALPRSRAFSSSYRACQCHFGPFVVCCHTICHWLTLRVGVHPTWNRRCWLACTREERSSWSLFFTVFCDLAETWRYSGSLNWRTAENSNSEIFCVIQPLVNPVS